MFTCGCAVRARDKKGDKDEKKPAPKNRAVWERCTAPFPDTHTL